MECVAKSEYEDEIDIKEEISVEISPTDYVSKYGEHRYADIEPKTYEPIPESFEFVQLCNLKSEKINEFESEDYKEDSAESNTVNKLQIQVPSQEISEAYFVTNTEEHQLHAEEQPPSLDYHPKTLTEDSKKLTCNVCAKTYTKGSNLKTHMYLHTGERPFPCDMCKKAFYCRGDLKIHVRTHTGEKPFSCEICTKAFSQRGLLKTHLLTHTGERPFSCDVCMKTFCQQGHLKTHKLTHTGGKPFSCSICNKAFYQRGNLQSHLLSHTGERPFSCDVCTKSFCQKRALKKHLLAHSRDGS